MQFGTIFEKSSCWNGSWFLISGSSCLKTRMASFTGHAHALPDLLLEEAVAHAHRGLEGELLALERARPTVSSL